MKHTQYALVLSVLAAVLIAGCVGQAPTTDCGTDMTCFTTAANTCSPAKVSLATDNFTMSEEITGKTGNMCGFKIGMTQPIEADAICSIPMDLAAAEADIQTFCQYCTGSMINLLTTAGAC